MPLPGCRCPVLGFRGHTPGLGPGPADMALNPGHCAKGRGRSWPPVLAKGLDSQPGGGCLVLRDPLSYSPRPRTSLGSCPLPTLTRGQERKGCVSTHLLHSPFSFIKAGTAEGWQLLLQPGAACLPPPLPPRGLPSGRQRPSFSLQRDILRTHTYTHAQKGKERKKKSHPLASLQRESRSRRSSNPAEDAQSGERVGG